MTVKVLFFSVLRDLAGTDQLVLELPLPSTLGEAVSRLGQRFPSLAAWDGRLLLAVNGDYADRSVVLADGDEVALMPPVQGG
jgi:molybdopterin converting factor subunit 1